jgi:aryl-alcohol dehydrogenase-like predicted oxidoreductase
MERFTEKNWKVLEVLLEVAGQLARPPAQVALNWVTTQPGVTSTLIGATKLQQLDSNMEAIEFEIPADARKRLDEASALEQAHPYMFFTLDSFADMVNGGVPVQAWSARAA